MICQKASRSNHVGTVQSFKWWTGPKMAMKIYLIFFRFFFKVLVVQATCMWLLIGTSFTRNRQQLIINTMTFPQHNKYHDLSSTQTASSDISFSSRKCKRYDQPSVSPNLATEICQAYWTMINKWPPRTRFQNEIRSDTYGFSYIETVYCSRFQFCIKIILLICS